MNFENILKYQKADKGLVDIENRLKKSPYKVKEAELQNTKKKASADYRDQELRGQKFLKDFENIKKNFEITEKKLKEILSKDVANMSLQELERTQAVKEKIEHNLKILQKMFKELDDGISSVTSERIKTVSIVNDSNAKIGVCKKKIEEEQESLLPEKAKIEKDLKALEKEVDSETMEKYRKKRQDGIFPVFVELEMGSYCGFCRMEQPKVALSHLKENGIITCEHCKRYIYSPKK